MLGTFYLICAAVGGALFLCQFLLSLLAVGGGHRMGGGPRVGGGGQHAPPVLHGVPQHGAVVPAHAGAGGHGAMGRHGPVQRAGSRQMARGGKGSGLIGSWVHGMVSLQALVAGATVFGLLGLATLHGGWIAWLSLGSAVVGALGAMFVSAALMRVMMNMDADGTVQISDCIGQNATVYLSVPGGREGVGKVMVNVHNRTMEYPAVTYQPEGLGQGSPVVVVGVQAPGTLEVVSANSVPTKVEL